MNLKKEIEAYCKLNKIDDVESFKEECLRQGFNIIKYGISPQDNFKKENNINTKVNDVSNGDVQEVSPKKEDETVSVASNNDNVEKPKRKKIKIIKK